MNRYLMTPKGSFVFWMFSSLSVLAMAVVGDSIGPNSSTSRVFGLWFLVAVIFLLSRVRYIAQLFAPSFLALIYLGLSYWWGSSIDESYHVALLQPTLSRITSFKYANVYLLICLLVLAALGLRTFEKTQHSLASKAAKVNGPSNFVTTLAFVCLLAVTFIDFYLLFGFRFGLAVIVAINLSMYRSVFIQVVGYVALLLLFLISSYENKREIIIIFSLILFLLFFYRRTAFRFDFKNLFRGALVVSSLLLLIIAASISRGYGSFYITSPLQSLFLVPEYIESPAFSKLFLANIEIIFTYSSTVAAIYLTKWGDITLQAGATFIKPLFLPIPRDLVSWKPESALTVFTSSIDPLFATHGASQPVTLPAEAYMNFHIMGVFVLGLVVAGLDRVFRSALRSLEVDLTFLGFAAVVLSTLPLLLIRGGGFDLYILTVVLAVPAFLVKGVRDLLVQKSGAYCRKGRIP